MQNTQIDPCSAPKSDFGLENQIYLNTGAEGIPLKSCAEALAGYLRDKARGAAGRPQLYATAWNCKQALARLLGVEALEVALAASASDAINGLCNGLDWRSGDEIVINDLEFPSNVLPWIRLQRRGVRLRVLRSRDWYLDPSDFRAAFNSRTRLVFISHVSYLSGSRLDIAEIGDLAHRSGALFAVDATQSLGRIPVPLENVDYLVASTYKWLLSPHGGAVVFCRRPLLEQLEPHAIGWWSVREIFTEDRFQRYELKPDAARLESGMPNFPIAYALLDAVEYLNRLGVDRIEALLQPLCDELHERLSGLSVALLTPSQRCRRAGILSFLHPGCEAIAACLEQDRIQLWGGDGRIRISIHLYNDAEDMKLLWQRLPRLVAQ